MRKRILSLALVICLVLAVMPSTAFAITDAEKLAIIESVCDTSWYTDDPDAAEFHISTPEQLWGLAYYGMWQRYVSFEGKTIYIDADIDLAGFPDWMTMYINSGNYAFKGTLDGQNHVIFNLKGETFFGTVINSTLKNICISGAEITGSGILAAQVTVTGVVDSCIVSGSASGGNNAGAIIGGNVAGIVTNCISMATITAKTNSGAGGLIYNSSDNTSVVTGNIVLNYAVYGGRPASANVVGRVIGYQVTNEYGSSPKGTISGNVAYDGTIVKDQTRNDIVIVSDASGAHGQSVSLAEIYANGYLNRLPASFPIPDYLRYEQELANTLNVTAGLPGSGFGTADFIFEADLPANKVNLVEAVLSYDAENFNAAALVSVDGTVKLARIDEETGKIALVIGVANENAIANELLTALASITTTAKDGKTPEFATLTLESVTLYSKGEIVEHNVINSSASVGLVYRSPLDVNGDGEITAADLSIALYYFGAAEGDGNWDEARFADVNGDGKVDIEDISMLVEAIYGE